MRCAVFIGVCLVVLAVSEARSFGNRKLKEDLATRILKKGPTQLKAGLLSGISAKRSQGQPDGDVIESADELVFGVSQVLNGSVWFSVPEAAWDVDMGLWCKFKDQPWYDNVYMQSALGAIGYVKVPALRPLFDWVYKIFGEDWQCLEMQGMGEELTEQYGEHFNGDYRFVEIAIDIMSSQCERRAYQRNELVAALENVECDAGTTQVQRKFSSSQKHLSRKRRGKEDGEVEISRNMFKAIRRAGECLLNDTNGEYCAEATSAVQDYIDGLNAVFEAEDEVREKVTEIMCANLNEAVSAVANAVENPDWKGWLVDELGFQADFENLVNESCGSPPADQTSRDLKKLKELLLRNLQIKK